MNALSVVAEPRRQEILRSIWSQERCAGEIAASTDISFSAVSQHLAKLRHAGVVSVRRDGRRRWYSVRKAELGPIAAMLESFWGMKLARLKGLAESEEM